MDSVDWAFCDERRDKKMKRMINTSMVYFALAMAAGVFYREFTKFNGYTGKTVLSTLHTHFLVLGMLFFLIVALFVNQEKRLLENKLFKRFYICYNLSLPFLACTMLARGIVQVLQIALSRGADAAISGIAGLSHICITISLIFFFMGLKQSLRKQ